MKIKEILKIGNEKLSNVTEANLKLRLLISKIIDKPKEFLITHNEEEITKIQGNKILEGIEKLANNIPIQYIINEQEFMGIKLDKELNKIRGEEACISTEDSKAKIYIIPTNEEIMIARDCYELVGKGDN